MLGVLQLRVGRHRLIPSVGLHLFLITDGAETIEWIYTLSILEPGVSIFQVD